MPKKKPQTPEDLKSKVVDLLNNFSRELRTSDLRQRVIALVPVFHSLRALGASLLGPDARRSARDRIISYLQKYPFKVVDGDELMVVSGIQDYPRRVRELRVQFGWWIFSGVRFKEIAEEDPLQVEDIRRLLGTAPEKVKPDQYVLMRVDQDREAAHRWNQMNEIRKEKISVKDKILKYLRKNVGVPLSGEELAYLAGGKKEWARRVRELRTESGWPIATKNTGRTELRVGEYVLEEDKQAYEHDRKISDAVRVEVLERDGFRCVVCGWAREKAKPGDPRKMLELHHIKHHAKGGENVAKNLTTLCNVHHDEVHAGRLKL